MVDMIEVASNMKNFGLDERESSVYLALLESHGLSILELSKQTEIPRSTIYRITELLIEKGFAEKEVHENGTRIMAKDPYELDYIMQEQERRADEMKSTLDSLKDIARNVDVGNPRTKVRYYTGKKGLRQMLWNSLKAEDGVVGYSEFGRLRVVGGKFYDKYVEEFRLRGLNDKVLSNEDCLDYYVKYILGEENMHQLDESGIRILEKDKFYVSGDTSIYNDTYAVSYWTGNEVVGIEIENRELVKLHRSIFEILWGISKSIKEFND